MTTSEAVLHLLIPTKQDDVKLFLKTPFSPISFEEKKKEIHVLSRSHRCAQVVRLGNIVREARAPSAAPSAAPQFFQL